MKEYINEAEGRRLICEIGRRMYQAGLVAANDGNISVLLSPDEILCTPTGCSKGFMTEDDMIVLDKKGNLVRGNRKATSEIHMHIRAYQENPSISAVIHAHPVNATALAVAGMDLMEPFCTESVVVTGPIPLAPYATAGTSEVPDAIAPYCNDYRGVLLENHGAVVWAADLTTALYRMESLEHIADIYVKAKSALGRCRVLTDDEVQRLKVSYNIK